MAVLFVGAAVMLDGGRMRVHWVHLFVCMLCAAHASSMCALLAFAVHVHSACLQSVDAVHACLGSHGSQEKVGQGNGGIKGQWAVQGCGAGWSRAQ